MLEPGASGSECEAIFINNDVILEDDEELSVFLTTSDPDITIWPNIATLSIVDDDSK